MADKTEFLQAIDDAILDADSLERFINGSDSETVLTRLSAEYPTLQKALKELFENGGLPAAPFKTKTEMEASELTDGAYALVTDDAEPANNGLYVKEGGVWAKSKYNPEEITNALITKNISEAIYSHDRTLLSYSNLFTKEGGAKGKSISADFSVVDRLYFSLTNYRVIRGDKSLIFVTSDATTSLIFRVVYYDVLKNPLKAVDIYSSPAHTLPSEQEALFPDGYTAHINTPPKEAVYMRIVYRDGNWAHKLSKGYVFEEGNPSYQNALPTLTEVELSEYTSHKIYKGVQGLIDDNLLNKSRNLFNYEDVQLGASIKDDASINEDAVGYALSGFIPVEPDTIYSQSHKRAVGQTTTWPFIHVAFFDVNKRFIYRITNTNDTFRTPSNAHFIRVNTNSGLPSEHDRMLSRTDSPIPYEPYGQKIKPELIQSGDAVVVDANNLFDYTDTSLEYNTVIRDTGELALNSSYSTSDFIPVVEGRSYTISSDRADFNAFMYMSLYNNNREFLTRLNVYTAFYNNDGFHTVTIPEGASYVRLSYNAGRGHVNNRMFNEGSAPLPYDKSIPKLGRYSFSEDMKDVVLEDTGYRLKERSYTDMPFDGVYHSTQSDEELTQFSGWYNNTHVEVHSLYEALRDKYPNYIKKKQYGLDDWGNEFLAYTFVPERQPAETYPKLAKIYINCSIHGHEHAPALSTYLMMQQICDNWTSDPLLEALRFNVEFVIVPVANMGGYDDRSNKNRNNVNLNRSFTYGFGAQTSGDPSHDQYGGEGPFQEKETQYMAQVFDDHPDMDACFDYHCFGTGSTWRYMWTPTCDDPQFERLAYKWSNRMSHKWAKDFDFLPKDEIIPLGQIDYSYPRGMLKDYAYYERGVELASIVEVARVWNLESGLTMYDATHCRTLTEAITNLVLITADTLTKP